jgi:DNA-binding response OmpR family regulator
VQAWVRERESGAVKLLIADDDTLFRMMLRDMLCEQFELEVVENGNDAWTALQKENAAHMAILDWVMPGLSGPQVCRKVRERGTVPRIYLMLITSKNSRAEEIAGFEAGADDWVSKPFHPEELAARLRVGRRVVELQNALEDQVASTRSALEANQLLRKLVPPCSYCEKAEECLLLVPSIDSAITGSSRAFCPHWALKGEATVLDPQGSLRDLNA